MKLLTELKEIKPCLAPLTIMTDILKAFHTICSGMAPTGCFSHFAQSIWRQIQAAGLAGQYAYDAQFAGALKHLPALAFVPLTNVIHAFEVLCESDVLPKEADPIHEPRYLSLIHISEPTRPY